MEILHDYTDNIFFNIKIKPIYTKYLKIITDHKLLKIKLIYHVNLKIYTVSIHNNFN